VKAVQKPFKEIRPSSPEEDSGSISGLVEPIPDVELSQLAN